MKKLSGVCSWLSYSLVLVLQLQMVLVHVVVQTKCETSREATEFAQHASESGPIPTPGDPQIQIGQSENIRQGQGQGNDPSVLVSASSAPGHLQPLGSHRPSENPGVDVLTTVPDPEHFFTDYVRDGKPVVFRDAAKNMDAYQLWTDEYLSKKYGHLTVEVEEGKKENRSKNLWQMPLSQFIQNYKKEDVYLVTDVPEEMSDEFGLLKCLSCRGFTDFLVSTVLWYSSGGTKSVLHFDSVDNINCVMDGRKEIFLVDKNEKARIHIDHPDGTFSGVDVERVDLNKYPGLGQVPWYNVTLEKGDCLFIPYRWFHSVQSTGRNLAVNVWFIHQLRFDASGCHDDPSTLPEFIPLSAIKTRAHQNEHLRSEMAQVTSSNKGSLSLAHYLSLDFMRSKQEQGTKLFQLLDSDGDELLTLEEIYADGFIEACDSLGIRSSEEEEGEDDDNDLEKDHNVEEGDDNVDDHDEDQDGVSEKNIAHSIKNKHGEL